MTAAFALVAGLFGLAIGSFLNVVIHRVPLGQSVVRPPSACPECGHRIRDRHNVPVVGWLVLRGRCFDCRARISARYPLVELGTGVLFAGVTATLLAVNRPWLLPAFLYLAALTVVAALIARDGRPLPAVLVSTSYVALLITLLVAVGAESQWSGLLRAAAATIALAVAGLLGPRTHQRGQRDAREYAQLAVAPFAFLSWPAMGAAVVGGLLLVAVATAADRRRPGLARPAGTPQPAPNRRT